MTVSLKTLLSQDEVESESEDETWSDFDQIARNNVSNFKLGHINANSIGGFKFHEIRSWLLSGRFDVLIISESKIDATFPDSMFMSMVFDCVVVTERQVAAVYWCMLGVTSVLSESNR